MALKDIVKPWFKTGLIPTQTQFWTFFDSIWFKDEKIPIANIEEIEDILNKKADAEAFNVHLEDANAHPELMEKVPFVKNGGFTIYKHPTNNDPAKQFTLEINDLVLGFVGENWINAYYLGGDVTSLDSFNINTST